MKSLITAIENSLEKIENGSIELNELETMVNQSRELYERLVVVRYKVYADSVLGTKTPLVDKEEIFVTVPSAEDNKLEEKMEVAPFDFSLFEEEENANETASQLIDVKEIEEPKAVDFEFPTATEESTIIIEEVQESPIVPTPEEVVTPTIVESVSLFTEDAPTLTIEDVQPEIETEKKPVPVSNFDEVKFPTPVFANSPIEEVRVEAPIEEKSPEVVAPIIETPNVEPKIMETPVSYTAPIAESVSNVNQNESTDNQLAIGLKAIETHVRNKNSIAPLDTLIGSFSLNEKLTLINELFDGSSDEFSSSIKRLDSQVNLESAHSILADMAVRHNWDLESETTEELIFKICRRYANNASN
jgi:hypothetical protein